MKKKSKSKDFFESFDLIRYVHKRRKPLLLIILLAAIASVVVSLMITPRYRSQVVFFPATGYSVSRSLLSDLPTARDPMSFGTEEDAERLLQVMNSERIKSQIIYRYNLREHYGITDKTRYPETLLNEKYRKNIRFRKTQYMALVIEVLDKDPVMAADIANEIASLLDSTMNDMQQERAEKAREIVENEYHLLNEQIRVIEDSLAVIRRLGVIDYVTQSEAYHQAHSAALLQKDEEAISSIERRLRTISRYGGAYVTLTQMLENELKSLSNLKIKYQEALVNVNNELPVKFVIDQAYPSEKKAYPKRTLIVLLSTFSSFLLAFFLFLLLDVIRKKFR